MFQKKIPHLMFLVRFITIADRHFEFIIPYTIRGTITGVLESAL